MSTAYVLVGVPIYEGVKPRAYLAQMEMMMEAVACPDIKVKMMAIGPRVSIRYARNLMANAFLGNEKATHLLFLDDDIVPPKNLIPRLVGAHREIIGALVNDSVGTPIVFKAYKEGELRWADYPKDETMFRCWAVGTGAMLIKKSVFSELHDPYFYFERNGRTMDVNFCRDAQEAGIEVWCHAGVQCEQLIHENRSI